MSLVEVVREKQEALRVRDLARLLGVPSSRDYGLVTATVVCHGVQFFGEAAGVELVLSIENTKLIHSRIARNSQISMSAKFCVQIAYKQFLEFPNFQQLHLPIRSAGHLKGFFTVYTPSWHSGSLTFDEDSGEPSWNWLLDAGIVDRTAIATA